MSAFWGVGLQDKDLGFFFSCFEEDAGEGISSQTGRKKNPREQKLVM